MKICKVHVQMYYKSRWNYSIATSFCQLCCAFEKRQFCYFWAIHAMSKKSKLSTTTVTELRYMLWIELQPLHPGPKNKRRKQYYCMLKNFILSPSFFFFFFKIHFWFFFNAVWNYGVFVGEYPMHIFHCTPFLFWTNNVTLFNLWTFRWSISILLYLISWFFSTPFHILAPKWTIPRPYLVGFLFIGS